MLYGRVHPTVRSNSFAYPYFLLQPGKQIMERSSIAAVDATQFVVVPTVVTVQVIPQLVSQFLEDESQLLFLAFCEFGTVHFSASL
jgi:hypothetical protein